MVATALKEPIKVAFLDRDGVINHDGAGYTHRIEDFRFIEGVVEALSLLQERGYALVVVTNQSGIGRGYYSEADYQHLTRWYCGQLQQQGVNILDVFHCPHTPDAKCDCRKPEPGLFHQAANKYPIDFEQSLMFGDKPSDMAAAKSAGIPRRFLLECQSLEADDVLRAASLMDAIERFPL